MTTIDRPYASEVVDISTDHHEFANYVDALYPNDTGVITARLRGDSATREWNVSAAKLLYGDWAEVRAPIGAVAQTGGGPAVTVTGTPDATRPFKIQITTGGTLASGLARFRWSKDGGTTWDESNVTLSASHALGTTGLTAHFAAGTYVLGTTYEWSTGMTTLTNAGDLVGCQVYRG